MELHFLIFLNEKHIHGTVKLKYFMQSGSSKVSILLLFSAEHWLIKSQNTDSEWDNSYLNIANIFQFIFKVKACSRAVITFRYHDSSNLISDS